MIYFYLILSMWACSEKNMKEKNKSNIYKIETWPKLR